MVIGGGFIGLEAADNLREKGVQTTVIEATAQVLPNILDPEMASYVKRHLLNEGIRVLTGTMAQEVLGDGAVSAVRTSAGLLSCELLIMAAGIRPNTGFLEGSGLKMVKGTIVVDDHMKTNLDHVYAAGDCAMVTNRLTGKRQWSPMGSSANMEARTLAQALTGGEKRYPGVLGTGVVKLPRLNVGRTGLTQKQAVDAGYDVETVVVPTDDKAHYYPDAGIFLLQSF